MLEILKKNGKNVVEMGGIEIAGNNKVDLPLAVGGGSVCDYAKAVSVSVHCDEDP